MSNQKEVLLKVDHLCQYFGSTKAVDDVSFDIYQGEVFGLVGESGCGKTTTGRSIIGLYDITAGNIYFKGERIAAGVQGYKNTIASAKAELKTCKDSTRQAELKEQIAKASEELKKAKYDKKHKNKDLSKQIQMIFQDPIASLDPRMTVGEIISEGLIIQGEKNKQVLEEKVYQMLDLVGLVHEHAGRYPHEFSGGQKQRVGVARAIIMEPELVIADEPVSALDVSIQAQVINLLNELRDKLGLTILFIAHDLSVVKYFSDRIGVMYYGHMVELAPSDELFLNPLHPYTRALLSAIPLPDPNYEKQRKRIVYNPLADHDYSKEKPTLREVKPGHFVSCNQEEFDQYMKILK